MKKIAFLTCLLLLLVLPFSGCEGAESADSGSYTVSEAEWQTLTHWDNISANDNMTVTLLSDGLYLDREPGIAFEGTISITPKWAVAEVKSADGKTDKQYFEISVEDDAIYKYATKNNEFRKTFETWPEFKNDACWGDGILKFAECSDAATLAQKFSSFEYSNEEKLYIGTFSGTTGEETFSYVWKVKFENGALVSMRCEIPSKYGYDYDTIIFDSFGTTEAPSELPKDYIEQTERPDEDYREYLKKIAELDTALKNGEITEKEYWKKRQEIYY